MAPLIPLIPALITAGVGGTEMGLQMSGALSPSSSPSTAAATDAAAAQKQQEAQNMRAVAGNAQQQAPGLSDASMSQLIAALAGSPGDIGLAQQTVFGSPTSGTNVFSGSGGSGLATSVG